MPTITVDIDSQPNARKFLYLAKNLKFVKNARIITKNSESLSEEDWIKPGRPATEEEIEKLCNEFDLDTESSTKDEVRIFVKEELSKYRAGK
ncbi:MAG: hypothetical protein HW421_3925 [Ignavibacteria bacterium]|nr:hypothetical protein [Ignavibacteria bacterium]